MESPWRLTFPSVFVILFVNDVCVYSQNLPPGATPQFADYGAPGLFQQQLMNIPPYLFNGIYPDGTLPGRGFSDTMTMLPGPFEVTAPRSSIPDISQLLYSLPSPNLIGPVPIGPIIPPPLVPPLPQFVQNIPLIPCQQNPPLPLPFIPNMALPPPPYLGPNSPFLPGSPDMLCSQNTDLPSVMQFTPSSYPLQAQGAPMSVQFIPNPSPCPQESFNPQLPMTPPLNQYIPNATPTAPCPQPPPIVPPTSQFVPDLRNLNSGVPISQLPAFSTSPQSLYNLNLNDMGSISPFLPPVQGSEFLPNPRILWPYSQIQMLPPATPPFNDPNFALNQCYPEPNILPPYVPPQFPPISSQFLPDVSNFGSPLPPPATLRDMSLPNMQPIFLPSNTMPCNQLPSPPTFAQFPPTVNPTIYPYQQIYSPANNYQPFMTNLEIPPQFRINTLPVVLPPESVQLPIMDDGKNLPISLQINLPATNVPPPSVTIISTVPPNPPTPDVVAKSDSDSIYPLGNFIPFPTYAPPPIIVQGSKSKRKKWIPILIALFANMGCCGGCGGDCCCSCGNNVPIPFPVAIPTNNPILVNNKKRNSKDSKDDCGE